ncbi:MAG: SRPBCC family protein [Deltaproteobacteria bacterium]|jgi:uncharacterized protein YndB with AHSA1/START domain|nr:SRPBCC family protein [Deltaproteobacteria bacterium]
MWFKVRASDATFVEASKKHFVYDFRVEAPAADVFAWVTAPEHLGRWMADLKAARWVTGSPHGVGSVREVQLKTIAVHERVLAWEPGERFVFTIVRASVPILKRMVEDYRFEATGTSSTRVRWTIAYQPRTLAMPLEPLLAPRFSKMFEASCAKLSQLGAVR